MDIDLTDAERIALVGIIESDAFPQSPRIIVLRAILASLEFPRRQIREKMRRGDSASRAQKPGAPPFTAAQHLCGSAPDQPPPRADYVEALADIAAERGRKIRDVITEISLQHEEPNLSAATRVYIVKFYRDELLGRDG